MFGWLRGRSERRAVSGGEVDFQRLVSAYGAVLERSGGLLGREADLPAPKETLKRAIKMAWLATDDQGIRENLGTGFVNLAIFREGEPPKPDLSSPQALMANLGEFERQAGELSHSNADMAMLLEEWQEFTGSNS